MITQLIILRGLMLLLILLLGARLATANETAALTNETALGSERFNVEGYGIINYRQYDAFRNAQDDTPDRRQLLDIERFILEMHYHYRDNLVLEAEVEFEHGGTGSTLEYEAEEFGEYELEVEKGGEVKIEALHLTFSHSDALNYRIGRLAVPFGLINTHHHPEDYFTTQRSLTETSLIPAVWYETGFGLFGAVGRLHYRAVLVNGLDSSGFNSYHWIADGHQQRFEYVNADNLAVAARLDYALTASSFIGASVYQGDSADNRPRQNMNDTAVVTLYELHAWIEQGPWKLRTEYLTGNIENANAITLANQSTANAKLLGISSTQVAQGAKGFFVEVGYDIAPRLASVIAMNRLDLFARYDAYDSMDSVEGTTVDLARYDQTARTFGVNYFAHPDVIFKGEYSKRQHQGDIGTDSTVIALGLGFNFE